MEPSLHDNWLYAHQVDHDSRLIVLHTMYVHSDPHEFTDVIFSDVVVHHFEEQRMTLKEPPSNVLFEIEEEDPATTLERYSDLLEAKRNYGWPLSGQPSINELAKSLVAGGRRCFHIQGTVGLSGFVVAGRMDIVSRAARWSIEHRDTIDG